MNDTDDLRVDQPRAVRDGEGFDLAALDAYLAEHMAKYPGALEVRQFPSGHSNLTYALRVGAGEAARELVLRRPPFGAEKIAKGHDMGREFRILSGVRKVWDKVPEPIVYCEDSAVIGAPFYVMERLQGTILRGREPRGADKKPLQGLDATAMRAASETLVDTLVEIHGLDVTAAGLDTLGHPEGYVERQVRGWTARHARAKTDEIPEIDVVAAWLAEHCPTEVGATLVHNDFKYDNIVFEPGNYGAVAGVLDWELATVGDPLVDLGTTLSYWVEADDPPALHALPVGPTMQPGNLTRRQLAERWAAATGYSLDNLLFYYVLAVFKVAGIGQQIYYRYAQGDTKDPRFAMLIYAVRAMAAHAVRAIELERIDDLG